jgi:heme/copper-type cytochrome/quinol oxidase subunit 2
VRLLLQILVCFSYRWLPEDVSPYGPGIDSLFYFIYYITAAAFILVTALMVIFLFLYRRREGRRATYRHLRRPFWAEHYLDVRHEAWREKG